MSGLIKVEQHPAPQRLQDPHGDGCYVCRRKVNERTAEYIHLVDGGRSVAPVDDTSDFGAGDLGWFPVGPECRKAIPSTHRTR